MRTIWKFPLSGDWFDRGEECYKIPMPQGAFVTHVAEDPDDYNAALLWAEIPETEALIETRNFWIVCTGDPIPAGTEHVATYQQKSKGGDNFVYTYHLYEDIR